MPFTSSNDIVNVTFTPDATNTATYTDSSDIVSVTYDGTSNDVLVGSRLIDIDGAYITDINGVRILLGGLGTGDTVFNETAVTWLPDMDVL